MTIALYCTYDDYEFVTIEDLERHIARQDTVYTMADYLDRRKSTNIVRFNFDPFTGKKIDWAKLRKKYEQSK